MADTAFPMILSEEPKQAMEVLSAAMNLARYIYNADFMTLKSTRRLVREGI